MDSTLLPQAAQPEQKVPITITWEVFYMKSQADFQRYVGECMSGTQKEQISSLALQNYDQAHQMAKKELDAVHPTRLGTVLNYSVFHYETLNDISTAIALSREISDLAMNEIEKLDVVWWRTLEDESHKLATDILFQLRDNMIEWSAEWDAMEADEKWINK